MMLHHQAAATRFAQGPSSVASSLPPLPPPQSSRYQNGVAPPPPPPAPPAPAPLSSAMVQQSVPSAGRLVPTEPAAAAALPTPTPSSDSANNNNNHLKSSLTTNHQTPVGVTSPMSTVAGVPSTSPPVYGELIILGYNGSLPQGEKGRRRSKYQLLRRLTANGIKKSKHYSVKQPQTSKAIQDKEQHSISFTLSRSQAIIVEYQHDEETDMFQIGRSSEIPIDFVVIDTLMFDPNKSSSREQHSHHNLTQPVAFSNGNSSHDNGVSSSASHHGALPSSLAPKVIQQSTISRFACRILVDRKPPYCARIYAAGFDSSKNIFLGEKATKWQTNGEIDGLTTNGILIMHPKKQFVSKDSLLADSKEGIEETTTLLSEMDLAGGGGAGNGGTGGVWREVSVCGEIYSVRETRSASQKGVKIETETNVLQDGTLIDLCGATLMWRSADGLARSPTKSHLEAMIDQLNASRPQCPVGLNTLVIPRKRASLGAADDKQPYVYLNCGHVQGYHDWGQSKHSNARTCPMCLKSGPIVKLTMGIEPSFCTSSATPNFAFNPCGHMASDLTTKYWSQVLIPHGTNGFHAMCPFCATPLVGETGFVKLIFQ